MTDYVKTTNFADKDSTGAIVTGADFELEFNNVATAVATKANKVSPTLTGTVDASGATLVTLPANTTLGSTTAAEFVHLQGVSGAIQDQLDLKAPLADPTFTGTLDASGATLVTLPANTTIGSTTATQLTYLQGVTANLAGVSGLSDPEALTAKTQEDLDTDDIYLVYDISANTYYKRKLGDSGPKVILFTSNEYAGGSLTLLLGHAGCLFYNYGGSSNMTLVIPGVATRDFPTGTEIAIINSGSTTVTVDGSAPANFYYLNQTDDTGTIKANGGAGYLVKVANDSWVLTGDLV